MAEYPSIYGNDDKTGEEKEDSPALVEVKEDSPVSKEESTNIEEAKTAS